MNNTKKRPVISGKRKFCSISEENKVNSNDLKGLYEDLNTSGHAPYITALLKDSEYTPCDFFATSINEVNDDVEITTVLRDDTVIQEIFANISDKNYVANISAKKDVYKVGEHDVDFVNSVINVTIDSAKEIEKLTLGQKRCMVRKSFYSVDSVEFWLGYKSQAKHLPRIIIKKDNAKIFKQFLS